ncbi:MAG: hypothetical protein KDH09_06500 [Chrysiogenetes bacterium]|nr:hypothetical protein [Chrysiogenetes bacterium]
MSSFGERSLKLVQGEPELPGSRELERQALERERNYDASRKRNRVRATRRAGTLLQNGVSGRRTAD